MTEHVGDEQDCNLVVYTAAEAVERDDRPERYRRKHLEGRSS